MLGATREQGGTRSHTITVGGESALPYLHLRGGGQNRPVVALEIWDIVPEEWNPVFAKYYGDVYNDVAAWAKKMH